MNVIAQNVFSMSIMFKVTLCLAMISERSSALSMFKVPNNKRVQLHAQTDDTSDMPNDQFYKLKIGSCRFECYMVSPTAFFFYRQTCHKEINKYKTRNRYLVCKGFPSSASRTSLC